MLEMLEDISKAHEPTFNFPEAGSRGLLRSQHPQHPGGATFGR